MCGIFGVLPRDRASVPDRQRLESSAELLKHRGPDGHGILAEPGIGLAHTRLSLLDLSTASAQPYLDPSGRFVLAYNGELYNFKELRAELEAEGVVFRTTGDTEVLLQWLIHRDLEEALRRLRGMYAFAFFDRVEQTLHLVRDRMGMKPLVVYEDPGQFIFASELTALRPWVTLEPSRRGTTGYLFGNPGPTQGECFFRHCRIVPPGTSIRIRLGQRPEWKPYFRTADWLDKDLAEELGCSTAASIVDRVDEELQRSVASMLVADAPVGALCSGGVDSSLLLAIAAKTHSNLAIFHADVLGPDSEYEAARHLASHLKLDLKRVAVGDQDFIDQIPAVTRHYEHPFGYHPNCVPFLMVSRLVREHKIKAVLSGEGSDECYLGYSYIAREPLAAAIRTASTCAGNLLRGIPQLSRYLASKPDLSAGLLSSALGGFEREEDDAAVREAFSRGGFGELSGLRNVRTLNLLGYHLRTLLHRNDRLGMAAGIEARFPLLDEDLLRTAVNMPYSMKIRWSPGTVEREHLFLRDKWVLRKVADRYIPKVLSRRRKGAFPVTAFERMRVSSDYFRNSFVADFFELGFHDLDLLLSSCGQALRTRLLLLDVWGQICFDALSEQECVDRLRRHISFAT